MSNLSPKIYAQAALYSYNDNIYYFEGFTKMRFSRIPDWISVYHNENTGMRIIAIRGTETDDDFIRNFEQLNIGKNMMIDFLVNFIENMDIDQDKLKIVGHSYGGYIAQHIAEHFDIGGASFCSIPMGVKNPIQFLNPIGLAIDFFTNIVVSRILNIQKSQFTNYIIRNEICWITYTNFGGFYGKVVELDPWCRDPLKLHKIEKIVENYF